jgi:hypothetical protein
LEEGLPPLWAWRRQPFLPFLERVWENQKSWEIGELLGVKEQVRHIGGKPCLRWYEVKKVLPWQDAQRWQGFGKKDHSSPLPGVLTSYG